MDPITLGVIFSGIKLAQKIRNGSKVKCRMCEAATNTSDVRVSPCCKKDMCPSCTQKWLKASVSNCLFCDAHQG
jgi:hypothetical protein